MLEQIADNGQADDADRIKAMDLLGKYGALLKAEVARSLTVDTVLDELDRAADDPE